ncbi:Cuticlin-1 [Aphelenchoides bicaudatus]|nr:Cuticlin-1 [Aphelenchoides bicaudatus]
MSTLCAQFLFTLLVRNRFSALICHPKTHPRGIFISTQLVLAFNPNVLSKVDRVFTVQCFYMEMMKVMEKEVTINMPTPPTQTEQVPMPVCRYEVLNGSPEGAPVFYATIGQMVYHKWTCDTETKNMFCMVVHSCMVDDGNGDKVELIDSQGCAKDKFLLSNLDYVSDLMVGKEAHVYKYADRQSMFFDCKISLTIKEPGQEYCDVPNCPDPPRRRRSHKEIDTSSGTIKGQVETEFVIPSDLVENDKQNDNYAIVENLMCMSSFGITSIILANLLLLTSSAALIYTGVKKVTV